MALTFPDFPTGWVPLPHVLQEFCEYQSHPRVLMHYYFWG